MVPAPPARASSSDCVASRDGSRARPVPLTYASGTAAIAARSSDGTVSSQSGQVGVR